MYIKYIRTPLLRARATKYLGQETWRVTRMYSSRSYFAIHKRERIGAQNFHTMAQQNALYSGGQNTRRLCCTHTRCNRYLFAEMHSLDDPVNSRNECSWRAKHELWGGGLWKRRPAASLGSSSGSRARARSHARLRRRRTCASHGAPPPPRRVPCL